MFRIEKRKRFHKPLNAPTDYKWSRWMLVESMEDGEVAIAHAEELRKRATAMFEWEFQVVEGSA